jgi:hypothetical protein
MIPANTKIFKLDVEKFQSALGLSSDTDRPPSSSLDQADMLLLYQLVQRC